MNKAVECKICSSNRTKVAMRIEMPPGTSWDIYECHDCGVQFITEEPSPEQLEQPYKHFYTQSTEQVKRLHNPNYGRLTFNRQWHIIKNLAHIKRGRILDFGCAGGHFLDNVSKNWDKYGIELAADAREVAAQKGVKTFASVDDI